MTFHITEWVIGDMPNTLIMEKAICKIYQLESERFNEVEQPIHLDVFIERWQVRLVMKKTTKPVKNAINQALNRVIANEIMKDGFVRLKLSQRYVQEFLWVHRIGI